MFYIIFIN